MSIIDRIGFERWTIASFIILAFFGVMLRYMLVFPLGGISYMNILHAHSHYAFGGWVFLAFVILIARGFGRGQVPGLKWLLLISLISSLGMLVSFSFQGYKAVSITFSTLFLLVTYWFAALALRRLDSKDNPYSSLLIKAGIWCLVLSSLGPLALGVLKANGQTGALYQNAIYFYLHFQMNGWMLLSAIGLIFKEYMKFDREAGSLLRPWLISFILSAFPLFAIFTLWSRPFPWINEIAFIAAMINAVSWFGILQRSVRQLSGLPFMIRIALLAISLKVLFQIFVCIPQVGVWTFSSRNLIIGYVHLITLGCVTPILLHLFTRHLHIRNGERFYISLVVVYLILLFIQPLLSLYRVTIPHYQLLLLGISILFCISGVWYYIRIFYPSGSQSPFTKTTNIIHSKH